MSWRSQRLDVREQAPPAGRADGGRQPDRAAAHRLRRLARRGDLRACWSASGLLATEGDGVAAAFAEVGLTEAERRTEGDWAALLLRA